MSNFVETAADIEVKDRLWASTEREIERYGDWEAKEFEVGVAYSDGQKDATAAAKMKGYPKGLIRTVGRCKRLGLNDEKQVALTEFRIRIGLSA